MKNLLWMCQIQHRRNAPIVAHPLMMVTYSVRTVEEILLMEVLALLLMKFDKKTM